MLGNMEETKKTRSRTLKLSVWVEMAHITSVPIDSLPSPSSLPSSSLFSSPDEPLSARDSDCFLDKEDASEKFHGTK